MNQGTQSEQQIVVLTDLQVSHYMLKIFDPGLNVLEFKSAIAALCLIQNVDISRVGIASGNNPADTVSKRFEVALLRRNSNIRRQFSKILHSLLYFCEAECIAM